MSVKHNTWILRVRSGRSRGSGRHRLGFRESVEDILLTESGLIERASALGYFACALYMMAKGGSEFIRTRGYFVVLVTLFGCRELDFDKAFTTIGILKSRFFVSPDVPLGEKLAGFIVISILIWSVYKILSSTSLHFYQTCEREHLRQSALQLCFSCLRSRNQSTVYRVNCNPWVLKLAQKQTPSSVRWKKCLSWAFRSISP